MNQPRQQPKQQQGRGRRRRSPNAAPKRVDVWRPVPRLADPAPIVPVSDPTMVIRSLGEPPLQGQSAVAEHYFAAVAERAAVLATALALSADLLAAPDDPEDPDL